MNTILLLSMKNIEGYPAKAITAILLLCTDALVHGVSFSSGAFEIEVTQLVSQGNDDCDGAISMEINGPPIPGDTSDSLDELDVLTCGSGSGLGAGGLWFKFSGNGARLLIGVNATFDSQLGLYTGSCDDLLCIDGNDDNFEYVDYNSALELDSIAGETYYALVHGE